MSASERRLSRALGRIALAVAGLGTAGCPAAAPDATDAGAEPGRCDSVPIEGGALVAPDDAGCTSLRFLPCGVPDAAVVDRCVLDVASCETLCPPPFL